eukprot:13366218-Alexandrium_andersonii.AAC.1
MVPGMDGEGERSDLAPPIPVGERLLSRRSSGASSPRSCACRVCISRRVSPHGHWGGHGRNSPLRVAITLRST